MITVIKLLKGRNYENWRSWRIADITVKALTELRSLKGKEAFLADPDILSFFMVGVFHFFLSFRHAEGIGYQVFVVVWVCEKLREGMLFSLLILFGNAVVGSAHQGSSSVISHHHRMIMCLVFRHFPKHYSFLILFLLLTFLSFSLN